MFQVFLQFILGPGSYLINDAHISHLIVDRRSPAFKSEVNRFVVKKPWETSDPIDKNEKLNEKEFSLDLIRGFSRKYRIKHRSSSINRILFDY